MGADGYGVWRETQEFSAAGVVTEIPDFSVLFSGNGGCFINRHSANWIGRHGGMDV
jgi:hypothetical protein